MGLVVSRWFHCGDAAELGCGDKTMWGEVEGGLGRGDWLGPPCEYVGGGWGCGESLAAWYDAGGGVWLGKTCWDSGENGDRGFILWPGESCEGVGDVWFEGLGTGFDVLILKRAEPETSVISDDRCNKQMLTINNNEIREKFLFLASLARLLTMKLVKNKSYF